MQRPLLGRHRLLRRAVHHLEHDGGVVLAGLPWVGRTRLLREALSRIDAPHVMIRATRSGQHVPFGNLGPVAPETPNDPRLWLSQLCSSLPARDAIVAVDGAQFLDDRSALLLLQAAEERAVRLAVSVWRTHPAPDALASLWTDGLLPRLEVDPLDRQASDELIRQALGGAVEEATLLQFWEICGGYPLLIRDYLSGSRDQGMLVERDGLWTCRGRPVHSRALADTAHQVRTGLDPAAVDALELLAVAQPLDALVAERLVTPEILDHLERWDLFVHDEAGRYVLPAPGWAEALSAGLTSVVRRRLVRRLVVVLPDVGELVGVELVRVVCWHREVGYPLPQEQLLRAAETARTLGDAAVAAELAQAGWDADPVRARIVLADARARTGDIREAVQLLFEAAEETPDHTVAANALITAARLEYFRAGRADVAVQLLEDGVARTDDSEARAIVHAELGLLHALRGDLGRAFQMAAPVAADEERPAALRFVACRSATVAAVWTGRLSDARRFLAAGRAAAADASSGELAPSPVTLEFCEPLILLASGRPQQAIARAEEGYRSALDAGASGAAAVWALQSCLAAVPAGRIELALRRGSESVAMAERDDEYGVLALGWGVRAYAAITLGDAVAARQGLAALDAARRPFDARAAVVRHHIVAGLRALDGDLAAAARGVADAGSEAADRGQLHWAADLLHVAVRFGYPELAVPRITEIAQEMEGDLTRLWSDHARTLAQGDGDALERVAGQFLERGFALWGTEALVQAAGLHTRTGSASRAGMVRGRAGMLLEQLPGLRTPAVHGFGTEPLTRREREVATLAAEGRTSPEIAEQLVVSVRTVDNHLARVYRKLGISGRHELAYVLLGA